MENYILLGAATWMVMMMFMVITRTLPATFFYKILPIFFAGAIGIIVVKNLGWI